TCSVGLPGDGMASLRERPAAKRLPRIRVVAEAMGAAARDVGEVMSGGAIVRLRAGAGDVDLASAVVGTAERLGLAAGTSLVVDKARGVVLHGPADLLVADSDAPSEPATKQKRAGATMPGARGWRRVDHTGDVALDRMTLITVGSRIALFRPPRTW